MEASTEKILERILEGANKKAKSIIEEAQKSAEKSIEERKESANQNSKKVVQSLLKKAENEAEIVRRRVLTEIKRKASLITLSEKNRLVSNVLEVVKKGLMNLQKSKEYLPFIEDLIVDAGIVLGGGNLEIILNKNDLSKSFNLEKIGKTIADKTNAKTKLIISKEETSDVGVMVKKLGGQIFVDNTFTAILDRYENELKLKIAKILFSKND